MRIDRAEGEIRVCFPIDLNFNIDSVIRRFEECTKKEETFSKIKMEDNLRIDSQKSAMEDNI